MTDTFLPLDAEPEPIASQSNHPVWRFLLDLLENIVLAVVVFLTINTLTARVRVDGYSMRPTLENGEYVLVNRMAYRFSEPQRGDIIVFHSPLNPREDFIKRIIGLPGDTVEIYDGQVFVNGYAITEPYIQAAPSYRGKWEVPAGHFFVLGDNRNDSSDSHAWGTLDANLVIGKAVLVYWPAEQIKILSHPQLIPQP